MKSVKDIKIADLEARGDLTPRQEQLRDELIRLRDAEARADAAEARADDAADD